MERDQLVPGRRRSTENLLEGLALDAGRLQDGIKPLDPTPTGLEAAPSGVIDQADRPAEPGQSEVGVVAPEQEPVLGATGEHPVRLIDSSGDEVVDQDADVPLRAIDMEWRLALGEQGGVDPGDEPLRGGFLISGRTVDLAGEIEAGDGLGFQGVVELRRRGEVVFDGVAVPHDLGVLEAGDQWDDGVLDVSGEAGGDPVAVIFERGAPLGLEEDLVRSSVGEPDDLVLDRGAVSGSGALDLAGIHRGPVEVGPDQVVDLGRGAGDLAVELWLLDPVVEERERDRLEVAGLRLDLREVDGPAVESGRGAGLESPQLETERSEAAGEPFGRGVAGPTAGRLDLASVHQGLEERPGGHDDGSSLVSGAPPAADTGDPAINDRQTFHHLLTEGQAFLTLDGEFGEGLIRFLVGLGAGDYAWRGPCPG